MSDEGQESTKPPATAGRSFHLLYDVLGDLLSRWDARNFVAYALICAGVIVAWNGPFLLDRHIGGFDWEKEILYYGFLKHSLLHGRLPLSMVALPDQVGPPHHFYFQLAQSLSFLGNPETPLFSPLVPLLLVLPVVAFMKLFVAVHLWAGALGVGLLARRLGQPPWTALVLAGLLLLHPWWMQHVALGYTPHVTLALTPLILALLCGARLGVWDLGLAACLGALMLYEGGIHVFIWLGGALVLGGVLLAVLLRPSALARVGLVLLGTALLAAPRLLASIDVFGHWTRTVRPGYQGLGDIWGLLTDGDILPLSIPDTYGAYHTVLYDASLLVGRVFVVLVVAAHATMLVRWPRRAPARAASWMLAGVGVVFAALGNGDRWQRLCAWWPLLSVEHYPFRFLYVALSAWTMLVAVELAAIVRWRPGARWLLLALIPVVLTIGPRNRYYLQAMARPAVVAEPPFGWGESVQALGVAANGSSHPLSTRVRPDGVVIRPDSDTTEIELPWGVGLDRDFVVVGAKLRFGNRLTPSAARVELRARTFGFARNAALGWTAFASMLTLLAGWHRRRRRRPSVARK